MQLLLGTPDTLCWVAVTWGTAQEAHRALGCLLCSSRGCLGWVPGAELAEGSRNLQGSGKLLLGGTAAAASPAQGTNPLPGMGGRAWPCPHPQAPRCLSDYPSLLLPLAKARICWDQGAAGAAARPHSCPWG